MQPEPQGGSQGHRAPEYAHRRVREKTRAREGTAAPFQESQPVRLPSQTPGWDRVRSPSSSAKFKGPELPRPGGNPAAGSGPPGSHTQRASPGARPPSPHMSTKTMKHQPRPPTSSMVTWMP